MSDEELGAPPPDAQPTAEQAAAQQEFGYEFAREETLDLLEWARAINADGKLDLQKENHTLTFEEASDGRRLVHEVKGEGKIDRFTIQSKGNQFWVDKRVFTEDGSKALTVTGVEGDLFGDMAFLNADGEPETHPRELTESEIEHIVPAILHDLDASLSHIVSLDEAEMSERQTQIDDILGPNLWIDQD